VENVRKVLWLAAIMLVLSILISSGCSEPDTDQIVEPLSSVNPVEHTTDFPKNLRWLTDEEKAKITEIAMNTDTAQEWLQKESQYKTAIDWIALYPDPEGEGFSGYERFEYEIVEKGIPRGTVDWTPPGSTVKVVSIGVPEDAEIYPCVTIWFDKKWVVSVAVDVESGIIKYEEDYPYRTGPTITTGNEGS
jgi:hypothetical protein